jgi:glycosyltransferase involved in cell wall biosynthesis
MLTVLMATHNGADTLPAVLEAYMQLEAPEGEWNLVIVDNGSTDHTKDIIRAFAKQLPVTYVFEPRRGKNRALNTGLASRSGDLIVFTDDDTVPRPDWLTLLRSASDAHQDFHIFGGPIQPRWPSPPQEWILKVVPLSSTFTILPPLDEGPIQPTRVFGPNMAIRAEIFEKGYRFEDTIGPDGTQYPMGSESELTRRLARAGYKAWHCQGAVVEHIIRPSQMTQDWMLERAIRYGRGQYRLRRDVQAQKSASVAGIPVRLLLQLVRQSLRVGHAELRRDTSATFKQRWTLNYLIGHAREANQFWRERRSVALPSSSASPAPLLPDVGIVALVPDVWGGAWQPRHQVLTRLARYFHVVWCDPARSWRRILAFDNRRSRSGGEDSPSPSIVVYRSERWLPAIGRIEALGNWTLRQRLRRARNILRSRGCQKIVLYIWRPAYSSAPDLVEHDLRCYHIDDEYTFSPVEQPISTRERRLIEGADRVFIHSPALLEKKGTLNPHTIFVPNGVDFEAYATPQPEPEDLRPIPHPRVGYVGRIKGQLDLRLLAALAARHGLWSFVFVGPLASLGGARAWVEQLSSMPNVYFLGEKNVGELPAYTQHLDVCTMGYVLNDYTKFIYPLKLHEYLAAGRPVVATPVRSLQQFAPVIQLATTEEEWSHALEQSLSVEAQSPAQARARQDVARGYDWNHLVQMIAQEMCHGLGPPYAVEGPGTTIGVAGDQ